MRRPARVPAPIAGVLVAALAIGCQVAAPTPSETVAPSSRLEVLTFSDPDTELTIPAVDADGAWGTITLRRGADVGGYVTNAADPGAFVVEVIVGYVVQRDTEATFGERDWALVAASDRRPIGRIFVPAPLTQPWETWERPALARAVTTEMIAVEPRTIDGWLLFEVPREFADVPLELVYRPEGFSEAVSALAVREASAAPDPVPTATPEPRPRELAYVQPPGAPFSVIADEAADALFVDADTCTNSVAGYTVSFPEEWYTNTAVGATPACSWFSPTFYEVNGSGVPEEIVIEITSFEAGIGFVHEPDYTISEQVTVDGRNASRIEEVGGFGANGWLPRSRFTYQYTIWASDDPLGLKIVATTTTDDPGDYEGNKAVLDRIIATLELAP
jgi:hypothetical protein